MYRLMTFFRDYCLIRHTKTNGLFDQHSKGEWEAWDRVLHPRGGYARFTAATPRD